MNLPTLRIHKAGHVRFVRRTVRVDTPGLSKPLHPKMRTPPDPLLHRLRLELILKGRWMMPSDLKRMNILTRGKWNIGLRLILDLHFLVPPLDPHHRIIPLKCLFVALKNVIHRIRHAHRQRKSPALFLRINTEQPAVGPVVPAKKTTHVALKSFTYLPGLHRHIVNFDADPLP